MSIDHEEALKGEIIKEIYIGNYGIEITTESGKHFSYEATGDGYSEYCLTYIDPVSGQEVGSYDIPI